MSTALELIKVETERWLLGAGEGGNGDLLNACEVLEIGCTTMCTLKNGEDGKFYAMYILPKFLKEEGDNTSLVGLR